MSKVKPAQFLLLSVVLILVVNLIMGGSPTIHLHVNNAFSKGSCYNSEIRSTGKQSIKATKQQHQLPNDSLLPTRRAAVIGKTPNQTVVFPRFYRIERARQQQRRRGREGAAVLPALNLWRRPCTRFCSAIHMLPPPPLFLMTSSVGTTTYVRRP